MSIVIDNAVRAIVSRRNMRGAVVEVQPDVTSDAWRVRAHVGTTRDAFRFAQTFISGRDAHDAVTRGGSHLVRLVSEAVDVVLVLLFPPVVPFRIGTRSPKRLRIKAAA